jgi:hypothetical protein
VYRGLTVERCVRNGYGIWNGHGVRHEGHKVYKQNLVKPYTQLGADHRTGVQQFTVGLDLAAVKRHPGVA